MNDILKKIQQGTATDEEKVSVAKEVNGSFRELNRLLQNVHRAIAEEQSGEEGQQIEH